MTAHRFVGGIHGDFRGVLPPASITCYEGYRWYAGDLIVHRSQTGCPGETEYFKAHKISNCIHEQFYDFAISIG